jgi:hypothetical protein
MTDGMGSALLGSPLDGAAELMAMKCMGCGWQQ